MTMSLLGEVLRWGHFDGDQINGGPLERQLAGITSVSILHIP